MECQQCLPLSVVQLKGKHYRKPHCRNGVVDTFEHKPNQLMGALICKKTQIKFHRQSALIFKENTTPIINLFLFIGFSLYGYVTTIIDALLDRLVSASLGKGI